MTNGEPIRIAQIIGKWLGGGVESVVMNYYRNIDRTKIQFDFICDEDSTDIPYDEIDALGGKVILIPPYQKVFKYHKELKKVLKEGNYKIVHSHINTLSVFSLCAAKSAKVPVRIAHSHSTTNKKEWKKNLVKQVLRPLTKLFATDYMACTEHAGRWMFGNKEYDKGNVYVLNNAIDVDKFKYDEKIRKEKRKELNIDDDTLVIGHIGRFVEQKNHRFLIDIFNEVHKKNLNTILLLIGQGPLMKEIKEKVKKLNIENSVKFLGQREDVNELYQAMDLFLFPSLYEGLGMVMIEAQCSGLPCIASTEVPKIAKINSNVEFVGLNDSLNYWINIINFYDRKKEKIDFDEIKNSAYDIQFEVNKLKNKYIRLYGEDLKMKKNFLSKEECRKIQLDILKAIDIICNENNLKYCMCGGTMLGAIRHSGFIPWDDDIDIMLLRKDYNILIDILKKQSKYKWLEVLDYNTNGYFYPFAKAVDNTTIAKQDDNTTEHGIWVDIFPYDNLPNDEKKRNKFILSNYRKRSIILSMTTDFDAKEKIKHKYIKILLKFYSSFIDKRKFILKYNEFGQKYNNQDTKYVGCMFSPYKLKECFDREWFNDVKKYKFENDEFYGPLKADEFLRQLYGNYMELPPIEKRRNHKIIAYKEQEEG